MEFSPLATVGWSAAAVVVVCWLTLSFGSGATRLRAGWLGASAMYVTFGCLFLSLFLRARASDSLSGMLGFGFLLAFFSVGFVLAVQRTRRAFAGKEAGKIESATN